MTKGIVMLLVAVCLLLVVAVALSVLVRLPVTATTPSAAPMITPVSALEVQATATSSAPAPAATVTAPAAATTPAAMPTTVPGAVLTRKVYSPALGKDLDFIVYLPPNYAASSARYPVIYLLHGRGSSMLAWEPVMSLMESTILAGDIPATIFVMPDTPSSRQAGYYVDSLFSGNGALPPGEKVETALTVDLIAHIDATYRSIANRNGRAVAGFSMGGYGALRYLLAHPDLFRAAIALSPAVYYPLPPTGSSTREFGAFGKGSTVFDEAVYTQKNYPALFASFEAANLPSALFIAVGDDEDANVNPADAVHDLDYAAHTVYNKARRVKNLLVEMRVLDGGHNWDVWQPGLLEGLHYVYKFLKAD